MLRPVPPHLVVNAAMPITPETTMGACGAFLVKFLADAQDILHRVYGVGHRVPALTDVPWRISPHPHPTPAATDVVTFAVRLDLPDGGALFRAEIDRRGKVAEMMARISAAPARPA